MMKDGLLSSVNFQNKIIYYMDFREFKVVVNRLKLDHPIWFDLDSDKPP